VSTETITASSPQQQAQAAKRGAEAIRQGKLVAFATETVYGVAALASDVEAMERVRQLKHRPERPFSVHIASPRDAKLYVAEVPWLARRLIAKAWPGPVTLVLAVGGQLPARKFAKAGLYDVLCWRDTIGLRCPDHPLARRMLAAVGSPVVAPSANPPGTASPKNARQVLANLDGRIDLLIDSGPTRYGADSTIVAVDGGTWQVLREGVYSGDDIERLVRRTILFVCSGNTCRSPMAAGLAAKLLADRLGCRVGELPSRGWAILSAGVYAATGNAPSPEAAAAASALGADISSHRTQKATRELINKAELIFCMTGEHVKAVLELVPSAAGKVRRLVPRQDISDPAGGGKKAYESTAGRLRLAAARVIDKVLHDTQANSTGR